MTKRDFQAKEYAEELRQDLWPELPQENLFDDTAISAKYLEQIALAMRSQNIKGAYYVEDIAYQLDSLGNDYIRIIKSRDAAFLRVAELEKRLNTLLESQLWGVNCKQSAPDWLTVEQRRALARAFDLLCDDDGDRSFATTIQKMLTAGVKMKEIK
jgi:hypothetical protein